MYILENENLSDFMGNFFPPKNVLRSSALITQTTGNLEISIESFIL